MKRQDKYPDTTTFHFYNANPKNRITGDCVCRAVCTVLQQDYNTTLRELCEIQCKTGYDFTSVEGITAYMKTKGWVRCKQPRKRDNTKYTGDQFCRELSRYDCSIGEDFDFSFEITRVLINIGGHHTVAVVDQQIWDQWNSTDGCVGTMWVKPL